MKKRNPRVSAGAKSNLTYCVCVCLHFGIFHGFSASVEEEVEWPTDLLYLPCCRRKLVSLFSEGTEGGSSGVKEGGRGFHGVSSEHKVCMYQTLNKHSHSWVKLPCSDVLLLRNHRQSALQCLWTNLPCSLLRGEEGGKGPSSLMTKTCPSAKPLAELPSGDRG